MLKDCWTCEHFFYDRSTDASDCKKSDYLTEAQFEEYTEGIYE